LLAPLILSLWATGLLGCADEAREAAGMEMASESRVVVAVVPDTAMAMALVAAETVAAEMVPAVAAAVPREGGEARRWL